MTADEQRTPNAPPALLCAALEIALNRYLSLENTALAACAELSGRCIELRTYVPAWSFFIEFHGGGVRVGAEPVAPPDVRVSGALSNLLRLALATAQPGGETEIPRGLQIDGDVELLQRFSRILAGVGFDAEELAARVLGDAAAHRAVGGLRVLLDWGRRGLDTLGLDVAEYLREETGDLARAADVEEWMQAVERLRDDVARFEARLRRLETRAG
ncbi:ubiquinone biosynthesis protein UbiJ [Fontimonas thermophila]|uniref:Ubiquinone biosynthesis accessory factor UbiJ n=1 Tax=Fontimonas thermophila TaxID=1076937 RepID=A0A1I2JB28_9GAMM|nr:SCP2 sterol-binding domain-containing protein [Fontimonas thermophila]SFF51278.1 ubiquinone biosynthesis protein UbiJ [Fontimonas thermophila]